ncbi:MAG: DNA repair protein RecN [Marinosulfonomonas sp.]
MLRSLDIRDLLIIEKLSLDFQPGLTVLTGETGAGKSILLDALGFVLGWRGRAELVRAGAEQGEVVAAFDLPSGHPAQAILQEAGYTDTDELVLRRVNTADGRKTAWVNDRRSSGELLRQLSETLVELHGQHDDRGLLSARGHRKLLDDFAGLGGDLQALHKAWRHLQVEQKALSEAQAKLNDMRKEEEYLRHTVAELDELDPQVGEDQALDEKRRLMQAAERIREDILRAAEAVGPQGAEALLGDAARWLDGAAESSQGQLDDPLAALTQAMNEVARAQQGIESCLSALQFDQSELENTEERLFAIRALARKHNKLPDELGTFAIGLRVQVAELDSGDADLDDRIKAVAEAQAAYDRLAQSMTEKRAAAAVRLDKAMAKELAPLKMENARFQTDLSQAEPGPEGRDAVAFTVATNPGAPAGPINKIASGGELSRFLLALKVCLTRDTAGVTMIFDEIDRGVGGATADAVGRRLASLAEGAQVLVVTHSPQVAARGANHWQVSKSVRKGVTTSKVVHLAQGERLDEVARMLAGDTITTEARAAAQALLDA